MRIAFISDIHANREAFEATLAAVQRAHADRLVLLGDIVGYGADPQWCVEKTMALMDEGAVVLRGNHDQAVLEKLIPVSMNAAARAAIEWTRNEISPQAHAFLASLPHLVTEDDRLYVHASAHRPEEWNYILSTSSAATHFLASEARLSFCGHVHVPMLYGISPLGKVIHFPGVGAEPVPLLSQYRWLAVCGAVGQPRDGIASAAFTIYDTDRNEIDFRRAPYDVDTAAQKIRRAGLPEFLATRLLEGR